MNMLRRAAIAAAAALALGTSHAAAQATNVDKDRIVADSATIAMFAEVARESVDSFVETMRCVTRYRIDSSGKAWRIHIFALGLTPEFADADSANVYTNVVVPDSAWSNGLRPIACGDSLPVVHTHLPQPSMPGVYFPNPSELDEASAAHGHAPFSIIISITDDGRFGLTVYGVKKHERE